MTEQERKNRIRKEKLDVLKSLSREEQKLLSRVLREEADNLHMINPRGINDQLLKIVREEIQ